MDPRDGTQSFVTSTFTHWVMSLALYCDFFCSKRSASWLSLQYSLRLSLVWLIEVDMIVKRYFSRHRGPQRKTVKDRYLRTGANMILSFSPDHFCFFQDSVCVNQAGSNAQRSACLCLSSTGIKGMQYHAWLPSNYQWLYFMASEGHLLSRYSLKKKLWHFSLFWEWEC